MVKRQTNFKQVYLVDTVGLNNINNQSQNLQNSLSQNVSLSLPKTDDESYYPLKQQNHSNSFEQNDLSKNENVPQTKLENNDQLKTKNYENHPKLEHKNLKKQHSDSKYTNENKTWGEDDDTISLPDSFAYGPDQDDRYEKISEKSKSNFLKSDNVYDEKLKRKKTNIFTCTFCNRQFDKKILLKKHMYYHYHGRNSSPNIQQDKNESNQVDNPQNDDNDWIDIPDVNNVDMNDQNTTMVLRKDTQTKFPNAQNIMSNDKDIRKLTSYKCALCHEQFKNYESAKQHQLQIHNLNAPLKRSITNTNIKGVIGGETRSEELQSYWCSSCGSFFQNFDSLQNHLKKQHSNSALRAKRSKTNDKIKRSRVLYYSKY